MKLTIIISALGFKQAILLFWPVGQPSGSLQFCVAACGDKTTALIIDPIALAAIIILTVIMAFGVKESFWFNVGTVVVSVIAILLCIFMGEQGQGPAVDAVAVIHEPAA